MNMDYKYEHKQNTVWKQCLLYIHIVNSYRARKLLPIEYCEVFPEVDFLYDYI